jgi:hypothetical protein
MAIVKNSIRFSTGGSDITVVANYSALPNPTTVSGEFYWCSASQGTSWLPGSLGGTFYNSGLYYSNGTTWEFLNVPYNATQAEVDTGTDNTKFVTPKTFNDASKWSTKQNIGIVVSSSLTASNDTNYNVVANATFTDPTPAEGKGYVVFVRNGTATIGGVGYAVGRIIYRVFHSGAWSSTIYVDQAYIDAKVADSITNGVTTIAPSQNAVFDALALKSDLASPTFTGTPLAPTPSANDNSTKIATTAYVDNSVVVTKVLSADVTTTSTTAVDTNLSHPIASSEILKFSCPLSVTTASGGVKLQITVPAGAVVTGGSAVAQGGSTSPRFLNLAANTLSVAVSTIALTSPMNLEFTVKNSTTAGNVIVSFASATGGSTSILENSTMQIFKTTSV